MQGSLYVDDFVNCYKSKSVNSVERQLQLCLHKFKTGLMTMACLLHFCTKYKPHNDPVLHLDRNEIKVVKEVNFFGVI